MSTTTSSERTKLGYGLREEEGEDFWLFGSLLTIKTSAEDTGGLYCLTDVEAPPGVGSPWHVHRDEDEWFYVREGEFELYVGDAHLTLTAGGPDSRGLSDARAALRGGCGFNECARELDR